MTPRLVKRSKGQTPTTAGLSLDARHVIVGDACVVPLPTWSGLVGVMGLLSAEFPFGKGSMQARLFRVKDGSFEYLLLLRPEGAARTSGQLSLVYDRIAYLASRILGEEAPLLVGGGETYLRYRDRASPTGYDLSSTPEAEPGRALLLLTGAGPASAVAKDRLKKLDLYEDFLVRLRTVQTDEKSDRPRYLLCGPGLAKPLGNFIRRRGLDASIAPVSVGGDGEEGHGAKEMALFRLAPRAGQKDGIPAHLTAYLQDLPGALLLDEAFLVRGEGGRGVLVPTGTRPTVWLPNLAGELPDSALLVMTGGAGRNLDVRPFPQFIPLDRLTTGESLPSGVVGAKAGEGGAGLPVRPIRLVPAAGAGHAGAAALLSEEEAVWLGQLICRVPHHRLEGVRGAATPRGLLVVADRGALEAVPFGRALRRHRVGNVFLPLGRRFEPEVPDEVLREKLGLSEHSLSVFVGDDRLEVPEDALRPIVELVVAGPTSTRVEVRAVTAPAGEVRVKFVEQCPEPVGISTAAPRRGWVERLLGLLIERRAPGSSAPGPGSQDD